MTWLIFAIMSALVILAITRPLGRKSEKDVPSSLTDVDIYKVQLNELELDVVRGTLPQDEAEQTRLEISRRLLRSARLRTSIKNSVQSDIAPSITFMLIAIFVAVTALALYGRYGSPGSIDQPLIARLNAPLEKQPVDIQIANVEHRLHDNPKDALGWSVIAPVYFRMRQFDKSANAYRQLITLTGEAEDKLLSLGEALTFGNNGTISNDAKQAFTQALKYNPKSIRARLWITLFAEQDGHPEEATQNYRDMLSEDLPPKWKKVAETRLASLTQTNPPVASGNNEAQIASNNVLQGEQGAMIRGMVEGLAAKLDQNPNDLEGWLKLIKSYTVLKDVPKATQAVTTARQQFQADATALSRIEALTESLHITTLAQGTKG